MEHKRGIGKTRLFGGSHAQLGKQVGTVIQPAVEDDPKRQPLKLKGLPFVYFFGSGPEMFVPKDDTIAEKHIAPIRAAMPEAGHDAFQYTVLQRHIGTFI
jgi:hypothetical protein